MRLEGMTIEETAKEMVPYIGRVRVDRGKFRDDCARTREKFGRGDGQPSYQRAEKRLEQLGQKVLAASGTPIERRVVSSPERKID